MFDNLDAWKILTLLVIGVFLFGPERLPKLLADAAAVLRGLRRMARDAAGELSKHVGSEVRIEDLHPGTFVRKHLLRPEDEELLRAPIRDLRRELDSVTKELVDWPREDNGPVPEDELKRGL